MVCFRRLTAFAALFAMTPSTWVADASAEVVRVTPCPSPPEIDGILTDPCWRSAAEIGPFRRLGSSAADEPATRALVTYDREALYVAFECGEPDPERILRSVRNHDGPVWRDDCVELRRARTGCSHRLRHA